MGHAEKTGYFLGMSENYFAKIMYGGYVTDGEVTKPCCECIVEQPSQRNNLESSVEEGNDRLVVHIAEVHSEDGDFAKVLNG